MFVNFSHDEVTTGSGNYFRRSDIYINPFEHVAVQLYIWCVTVQRLFGAVMVHL